MNATKTPIQAKRLPPDIYNRCLETAVSLLRKQPSIRNIDLREAADVGHDQANTFFKIAVSQKKLIRKGNTSKTHYVLAISDKG